MIVEYIRYRLAPSQAKDFIGAYETASLSLKDSPHCLGYETHAVHRGARELHPPNPLGLRGGPHQGLPFERTVQAVSRRRQAVH